jgi:hypothetical protein
LRFFIRLFDNETQQSKSLIWDVLKKPRPVDTLDSEQISDVSWYLCGDRIPALISKRSVGVLLGIQSTYIAAFDAFYMLLDDVRRTADEFLRVVTARGARDAFFSCRIHNLNKVPAPNRPFRRVLRPSNGIAHGGDYPVSIPRDMAHIWSLGSNPRGDLQARYW